MIYHYDFLARQLAPAESRKIVSPGGGGLLSFSTRNQDTLTVCLRYDGKFRKEGEGTLDRDSQKHGCQLFTITYDDFWRESGGVLRCDGFFALPLTSPPRNLHSIDATKRSLYRHRQALVGDLQSRFRAVLLEWAAGPGDGGRRRAEIQPQLVPLPASGHGRARGQPSAS